MPLSIYGKSRKFIAICRLCGMTAKPLTNRACPVRRARRGVILNEKGLHHPFLAAFAAWLALCCAKMHGFATASFFPGRFFYFFTFFNSLFRRCGFQLAFSLHLKFLNTTRFDFSIGSLPPFTSSFYSNSHHFVSRATTRIRPLSLWLSQVLNVKSCSPHCAPAPPQ